VFVLLLAIASYLIRIPLPVGKSLLTFSSPAYFLQYIGFFIPGVSGLRTPGLNLGCGDVLYHDCIFSAGSLSIL
jgi:hypothetical protein